MKIAIVQTGCYGDNVNSTLLIKPLKNKYPDSIIDIYTVERYADPYKNNPNINQIFTTQINEKNEALNAINTIKTAGYDITIRNHPLFNKNWSSHKHPELNENIILSWVNWLEANDIDYEYPIKTELHLTDQEKEEAQNFYNNLNRNRKGVVLIEAESESRQSFWDANWTDQITKHLVNLGYIVLINSIREQNLAKELERYNANKIKWVGDHSIRTCAGIYDHCDVFISVSSGLSNACNTNQRTHNNKKWIEVVNSLVCSSKAVGPTDHKTFWHNNNLNEFTQYLSNTL